jgi:exonuclease III
MTSKGIDTTRIGALQANGAGGSPSALVTGWCLTIQLLLMNVFCISETRVAPEWKHTLIENLFLEKGFVVISHNRPSSSIPSDPHTNSSGVIIGIPLSTPGGLTLQEKDEYGRAVAACAPLDDELTLRIVGTYGPSAAMAPRFSSSIQGIREERATTDFTSRQMDLAFRKGWLCLILGDMNTFPSLSLDREGGDFILRNESLAISLLSRGAVDTFRWRHPDLRAFTYVHPNGTASRLDQIMLSSPSSRQVSILNAAIIDDPRHCRDHLIPLTDIASRIPSVPIPT